MSKIILIGYMGAGKSAVAAALTAKLDLPAFDLDREIERMAGMTVSEIFTTKGEIWFRKTEHDVLKHWLSKPESFILSLGGGTPCYANNHELIYSSDNITIYLKASIDTLYNRLLPSLKTRPLLAAGSDTPLPEFIAKHLFERRHYYEMASHAILTDHKTPDEISDGIIAWIAAK